MRDPLGHVESLASYDLLHLLTCSTCRDWVVGRLLEEVQEPDLEKTWDEAYSAVLERFATPSPELVEASRKRRESVERLFEELMQHPPARRLSRIRTRRFRSLDLLELLLETSHARQLGDPVQADELARLGAHLAAMFGAENGEAAAALPRAYSLGANARRLRSDPLGAEALLARAAPFLACPMERAFYCRTAALLRWEQGRTDEAAALLQHSTRLYASQGLDQEAAAGLTLLGLLHSEEEEHGNALALLARGWEQMERDGRPLIALRGGLALAACLGPVQRQKARSVLGAAWRLFSYVSDPAEMSRIYWFEGRALAALGDLDGAISVLGSVRQKLILEPSPAEAALVSVDEALVLAEAGRSGEIEALASGLESAFPETPILRLAVGGILEVAEAGQRDELRERVSAMAVTLRRAFRASGVRLKPLPFA